MSAMRLFEAIIEANSRAVAGDQNAGLHPTEFADELAFRFWPVYIAPVNERQMA